MSEEVDFLDSAAYVTANELVDGLLLRENDFDKKNKPLYLSVLKEVFQELNLDVIRQTDRMLLKVNKSLQCVQLPSNYLDWSSISVANCDGKFEPLVINKNIDTSIIDLGASSICGCSCGCSNPLCSNIQNYELISSIISAQMPNGSYQDFTATTRKKVYNDGSFVQEVTTPTAIYENNVHVDTILQTTTNFLCKLEVLPCGCIAPTPQNETLVFGFTDFLSIPEECGCPAINLPVHDTKYYNISDKGNRIHFPANFPYDTVLVRFFASQKTKDLRIPYMAQKAVRFGIKAEQTNFSSPGSRENESFIAKYADAKEKLAESLVKIKLSDFYKHILGHFRVL